MGKKRVCVCVSVSVTLTAAPRALTAIHRAEDEHRPLVERARLRLSSNHNPIVCEDTQKKAAVLLMFV